MSTVDNRLPTEGTQKDIVDALGTIAQSLSNTSGHTIVNPAGTAMASRPNLQFKDSHITDDSVNNTTKVEVVKEVTTAQFANETECGLYRIIDKPDSVINAEQVAYDSSQNVKQKIDEVDGKVGLTNLTSGYFSHTTGTDKYYIGHNVDSSKAGQVTIDTDGLHILNKNNGTWTEKYVLKPIKKITVTGSTSSVGSLAIDNQNHNWIILGFSVIQPTTGSYIFNLGFWNKGNRYIHITDESHNPVANLSISLDIYYMEA